MQIKNNQKLIIIYGFILISFLFLLSGCSEKIKSEEKVATGTTFLMDTLVQMKVYGNNAKEALDTSFKRMREIENEMSVSIMDSNIYKINLHPGEAIKVDEDTFRVINKALDYAKLTNGRFDPSIGPLVKLWGIGTKNERIPSAEEIKNAQQRINYHWVETNSQANTVKLLRKGMSLDLGAIAKGYAADEVRRIVKEYGSKSAYVNLGGNVLVIGSKPDGTPWNVGIQDPRKERGSVMASIKLVDKTIVTSGNYERYFERDGIIYHHILDPTTGRPARTGILSVSIITADSFDADALSTSVFILGLEKGMKLIENMDGVEAMFISDSLKVILTSGLKGKVKLLNSDFSFIEGEQ